MNDQTKQAMQMALEALAKAERQLAYNDIAPHECYKEAITALREALAQPQGEWVDLTWDDYLELAGQARFYVADPYSGINEFCSHEFTKAAIELFKEKNKCNK